MLCSWYLPHHDPTPCHLLRSISMKRLLSLARTSLHCIQPTCNIVPHGLACLVVDKLCKPELGHLAWCPPGSEPELVASITQISLDSLDSIGECLPYTATLLNSYHESLSNRYGLRKILRHSLWGDQATAETGEQGLCMCRNSRKLR